MRQQIRSDVRTRVGVNKGSAFLRRKAKGEGWGSKRGMRDRKETMDA